MIGRSGMYRTWRLIIFYRAYNSDLYEYKYLNWATYFLSVRRFFKGQIGSEVKYGSDNASLR